MSQFGWVKTRLLDTTSSMRRRFQFIITIAIVCTLVQYTFFIDPPPETLIHGDVIDNSGMRHASGGWLSRPKGHLAAVKGWMLKGLYGKDQVQEVHDNTKAFLTAYQQFIDRTDDGLFCTPAVATIQVRINNDEAGTVREIDISRPLVLDIHSACDAEQVGAGDFYETLLYNNHFRARVTLRNHYNGFQSSIPLSLPLELVDVDEPLRFRIWRLYRDFEGIVVHSEIEGNFTQEGPYSREEIFDGSFDVSGSGGRKATDRPFCQQADFEKLEWSGGFWLRSELNDKSWRYYLPHCRSWEFTQEDASECLANRWLVFLGDSTSEDMMRNTYWTFLGDSYPGDDVPLPMQIPRQCDWNLTHPTHADRWTRISHLFNGHYRLDSNRLGMASFRNDIQTHRHDLFFDTVSGADTFLINSGLHDAWVRETPQSFVEDFDVGWRYYIKKIKELEEKREEQRLTQIIYRWSNVPPIHLNNYPLVMPMNPSSMEMVNLLERDYLSKWQAEPNPWKLSYLDSFDITWPWHFDAEMNSGSHYGRAPWAGTAKKVVDDQLVQYFLTDLCPSFSLEGNQRNVRS